VRLRRSPQEHEYVVGRWAWCPCSCCLYHAHWRSTAPCAPMQTLCPCADHPLCPCAPVQTAPCALMCRPRSSSGCRGEKAGACDARAWRAHPESGSPTSWSGELLSWEAPPMHLQGTMHRDAHTRTAAWGQSHTLAPSRPHSPIRPRSPTRLTHSEKSAKITRGSSKSRRAVLET
jgi:hypothetical protein